jgi:hypothetical protein
MQTWNTSLAGWQGQAYTLNAKWNKRSDDAGRRRAQIKGHSVGARFRGANPSNNSEGEMLKPIQSLLLLSAEVLQCSC